MKKEYHLKSTNPPIILLRDAKIAPGPVTKVGVVPFIPAETDADWRFMLMKPHAEAGHPGAAPEFQMAKGTRRIDMGGGWCDMRDDDLLNADPVFHESLIDAALREGEEEIGLKPANILKLYDAGVFSIVSARRRISKRVHVFAAEIKQAEDFGRYESKTAETLWMTQEKIAEAARADHASILKTLCERLQHAFFAGK